MNREQQIRMLRRALEKTLIKKRLNAALEADRKEIGGMMRKKRDNVWCLVEETPRAVRISDEIISALVGLVAAVFTFYVALPLVAVILTSMGE